MPALTQPSFSRGEISPELLGRVDTNAYQVGLDTARNVVTHTYGGVSRRAGTTFIGPVKDHTVSPRLIPFRFKSNDQYVLEFGDNYMRVIRDNGYVLDSSTTETITGITEADPAVVTTSSSHSFSTGEHVYISGVSGMIEVNNRYFQVGSTTSTTFELLDQYDGGTSNIDSSAYTSYSSGGSVSKIFELSTNIDIADARDMTYSQSADVMTLANDGFSIQQLTRNDNDDWDIAEFSPGPSQNSPTGLSVTINSAGSATQKYALTSINRNTGEESLAALSSTSATITNITQANPAVVTTSGAHNFEDHDEVHIDNVSGMTEINDSRYLVTKLTATTFELRNLKYAVINSTGFTAYSSGGTATGAFVSTLGGSATLGSQDNTLSWTRQVNAASYNIYRLANGVYSFLGQAGADEFQDDNIDVDLNVNLALFQDTLFSGATNNPRAVGFFQQRRVFGGTDDNPDTCYFSQTGLPDNYNKSVPTQADDALTVTLTANQVNEIRHFIAQEDLLIFTSGSEWRLTGGLDEGLTAETVRVYPQSRWGSAEAVPPIVYNNEVIYLGADERTIRALQRETSGGYQTNELNTISRHLLITNRIVSWSETYSPDTRIYMVRNDGVCLVLTRNIEQEVNSWTRLDTSGDFEDVTTLHNNGVRGEDDVYFVVKRQINGNTVRLVEYMRQLRRENAGNFLYSDSSLALKDSISISDVTLADPVVITTDGNHGFSDGDEVDIFGMDWEDDLTAFGGDTDPGHLNGNRYLVANKTATTFELTDVDGNDIDGTGFNAYLKGGEVAKANDTVTGLWHLEGRTVTGMGDGNVLPDKVVTNGEVSYDRKFSRISIGLKYVMTVKTLPLSTAQPNNSLKDRKIGISRIMVDFYDSRAVFIGLDSDHLTEIKWRTTEDMGNSDQLFSGKKEIFIPSNWEDTGQVLFQSSYPLPVTILSVTPEFDFED